MRNVSGQYAHSDFSPDTGARKFSPDSPDSMIRNWQANEGRRLKYFRSSYSVIPEQA